MQFWIWPNPSEAAKIAEILIQKVLGARNNNSWDLTSQTTKLLWVTLCHLWVKAALGLMFWVTFPSHHPPRASKIGPTHESAPSSLTNTALLALLCQVSPSYRHRQGPHWAQEPGAPGQTVQRDSMLLWEQTQILSQQSSKLDTELNLPLEEHK